MPKTTNELRRTFLDFYKDRGHPHLPMAPLVPLDDPTLLFTSAGMVPFKSYYASPVAPPTRRAVTVQRCLRLTDIENIGVTVRHCTLFEMLGNFSFGDYFKKEAIEWAWELITVTLGMPKERLFPSVFREDDEAFDLWAKHIGLGSARVTRLDEKDNFWGPAGGSGPCGPCSEIYWDQGPGTGCGRPECAPGCDCERYLEFYNLVFPQYDQAPDGSRKPLPNRGIDTGMGLERLAMILQGVPSIYDNDLLRPIGDAVKRMGSPKASQGDRGRRAARVITDHVRALVFTFAEGVRPSNEGRGYVARRLLRRAARFGRDLEIHGPFLSRLVPPVVDAMAAYEEYEYLRREQAAVAAAIHEEEARFAETLETGMTRFEETADSLAKAGSRVYPGSAAFMLYDTYGFPIDLTAELARERGLDVDMPAYEAAMEEQRDRARKAGRFETRRKTAGPWQELTRGDHSKFVGYDRLAVEDVSIRSLRDVPAEAGGPREVELTLDTTPFYAEGGGQVGDTGWLEAMPGAAPARLRVVDTVKEADLTVHRAEVVEGAPHAGPYRASVDAAKRAATERNHTATHLLHAALRARLGTGVKQAGSLVAPDRLRFDFSYGKALTPEDLHAIESEVNRNLLEDLPVATEVTSLKEAQERGAMALFGEKYGERVRQVIVDGVSRELCGGCHVSRTGEIGYLRIESESAIASGVRRIEAVTGALAYQRADEDRALLREIAHRLGAPREQLAERLRQIQEEARALRDERAKQSQGALLERVHALIAEAKSRGEAVITARLEAGSVDELRQAGDVVRKALPGGGALLLAVIDGKLSVAAVVGPQATDRLQADQWVRDAVSVAGGKGGGKKDSALAGAKDPALAGEVLERGAAYAAERMKGAGAGAQSGSGA
ncbi:MAG TPA: alanine--tRNA ligase [Candidatus Omnitrophota bacterium]|nr:alanine--tRNA ligase [Candidatus Omnitrophota bacterium]